MTQGKKTEPDIKNMSENDIIESILKKAPDTTYTEVELPSKGRFYDTGKSTLEVRPMTFADEKVVMSNANINKDTLNMLISRCVKGIGIPDLLIIDKLFLVMKIRELSYGGDYRAVVPCPECRHDNDVTFDIGILNVNYIPDDLKDPREIELAVIEKMAKVKMPRVKDEKYLKNFDLISDNLWRFISEIDGHSHPTIISKVVSKLPIKDIHTIVKGLGTTDYGLDSTIRLVCSNCSHHSSMELPISSDFFMGS
jgi:hypothetical protein